MHLIVSFAFLIRPQCVKRMTLNVTLGEYAAMLDTRER